MTPIGKNVIVKSFALSQLVFLFQVLPDPPDYFIQDIQGCIFDFIWSGNPDKVKRNTIYNSFENGGLKVTQVRSFISALKITWVKRYRDDCNGIWKLFFDHYLGNYGGKFLFDCNFTSGDLSCIKNIFIRNVCNAWGAMNFHCPQDNFGTQILWNNSHIKVNKAIIFYEKLFEAGVIYVRDVFRNNNSPLTFQSFCDQFHVNRFPFTDYFGLIAAIPKKWKSNLFVEGGDNVDDDNVRTLR